MREITHSLYIKETSEIIFSAITNATTIELWTGFSAIMEPVADTEFSLWDGDITGKNLAIEPDSKLVQEWYFEGSEQASIVTIELQEFKGKTRIILNHTNIPDEAFENIEEGWKEYYFGALKKFLES